MDSENNSKKSWGQNPIYLAQEKSKLGHPITPFSKNLAARKSYIIHQPQLIQEVFVKRHLIWQEDVHPFKYGANILKGAGAKILQLPHKNSSRDSIKKHWNQSLDNIVCVTNDTFEALAKKQNGKPFDLFSAFAKLSIKVMVKALYNFDTCGLEEKFYDAAMAHEDFLATMRRSDPKSRNSLKNDQQAREIIGRQEKIAEIILESTISQKEMSQIELPKHLTLPRVIVRTLLNSYAGVATTMTWIYCLFSRNPEVQTKLSSELTQVLKNRLPTGEDLGNLAFNSMIINEALRLYPAAWMMTRTALKADSVGGINFEKGDNLHVCLYSLHRDANYWANPDEFIPERFKGNSDGGAQQYAYLPFGLGPHKCVGTQFALSTMQLMLATLGYRYTFKLDPSVEIEPIPRVALRPYPGAYGCLFRGLDGYDGLAKKKRGHDGDLSFQTS